MGGAAEITSVVGRGTTVTITVPVAGAGDMHEEGALATDDGLLPHEVATWGEEGFKPIYVVAVLTGVVHVYAALSRRDDVRDLGVLLVCLTVVVVALTSLVLLPRSKRRSAGLIAALSSGVPFVATLNLQSPSLANWSYWFIGSVSVITAIVCFRWSVRWAVGVVAATVIGIPMAHLKVGGVVWTGPLADSLPQTFAFFARPGLSGRRWTMRAQALSRPPQKRVWLGWRLRGLTRLVRSPASGCANSHTSLATSSSSSLVDGSPASPVSIALPSKHKRATSWLPGRC
ncbi:MAG: hypothetical protein IPN45_04875 [Actinomycetales bacterium]|nr:hypothetical protein [Actinomycetales bacterium]